LTQGPCPISCAEFSRLVAGLELTRETHAVVLNGGDDSQSLPRAVRQIIITPLCEGQNLFGWLAAINHVDDAHFGALEANLLNSVAAILGIHNGNIELYRQQGDLLAGVVRALTSAIDAKDPYTCGHSDRVANVAVEIGRELAFDKEQLSTLYLSGLLHDIGKIGIDDRVLRKPDKLTPEEFEHIKTHTVIGHRILKDLKQLDQVLPVVLHHHENWDGAGYPSQLAGDQIPLMARIVAVADAFDAMSSNRSYRPGISRERIFEIFRAGSDRQWDLRIVEAFFRAQTDAGERAGEIDDVAPLTAAHAAGDDLGSLGDNADHEPTSQRNS
jgi:HD-GYP domain-containing protein (c-di-GMP phosphodiesterase class II)